MGNYTSAQTDQSQLEPPSSGAGSGIAVGAEISVWIKYPHIFYKLYPGFAGLLYLLSVA